MERTRGGAPWAFPENGTWALGFDGADRELIRWRGGCNHTGAAVVVTADRLVVDDGPRGSTAAGCDDERTAEDGEAAAFFVSDPTWSRSGDELLLTAGGTVVRLVLATGWPPEPSS